jgi:hypothetical protein
MLLPGRLLLLVLLTVSGQTHTAARKDWSFAGHIGIAASKSGKVCLGIRNPSLATGSAIRLINPMLPQTEMKGTIVAPDSSCTGTAGSGEDQHYYAIQTGKAQVSAMPLIAISGFSGTFRKKGNLLVADLDADGSEESFHSCTSTEGIHFTVWSGQPLDGKIRWHQYYYLGYDVSPTCTPKEIGE